MKSLLLTIGLAGFCCATALAGGTCPLSCAAPWAHLRKGETVAHYQFQTAPFAHIELKEGNNRGNGNADASGKANVGIHTGWGGEHLVTAQATVTQGKNTLRSAVVVCHVQSI
jgi:hypothetical protein